MSKEIIETESQALVVRERSSVLLMPVMDVNTAMKRLQEFQTFISSYLVESDAERGLDGDYGVIPGTKKRTLLKPGADKLCEVYGLYDEYELISSVETWDTGLFDYTFKCILKSRRDDSVVGTGVGSCSSFESRYRWRDSQRKCPKCGKENIRKSKGDKQGWYCWVKTGGCGATFKEGDAEVEKQVIGRVENPDIIDTKNTVLKMAKKRAKIDAVIGVTRSSGIFTQDVEDFPVAAAAPPPPVTDKDIDIRGHDNNVKAQPTLVKGAPQPPVTDAGPPPAPPVATEEQLISIGQQKNFHRECRAAVRPAKSVEADNLTYQWLKDNGYVKNNGEPTASMIPASLWPGEREKACAWLKTQ